MKLQTAPLKILVADDDKDYVDLFIPSVEGKGRSISSAYTPESIMKSFRTLSPHIVFLDYDFNGRGLGIELLKKIKKEKPDTVVVMVTAKGTKEVEMESMKSGTFNYLNKDDDPELNEKKINRMVEMFKYGDKNRDARMASNLVGFEKIEEVYNMISRFSRHEGAVVLVTGESGTGKQLVAKNIHLESGRRKEPFLSFNCCAVPDSMIEAQLFGYEKGAFTGAVKDNKGIFKSAGNGTVFLDEIGAASLNFQMKLLHVLETKEYFCMGAHIPKTCHARFILATNEDLEKAVEEGRFRKDLYYRINNLNISMPSLDELKKDIPLITGYMLNLLSNQHKQYRDVSPDLIKICEKVFWEGNVRQLRGTLERCLLLAEKDETITAGHFKKNCAPKIESAGKDRPGNNLKGKMETYEKGLIRAALDQTKTQKEAAKLLGILEATLSEKIKKYKLK